jgi:hypothetical protein
LPEEGRRIPLLALWTSILAGVMFGILNRGGRNDW